MKTFLQTRVPDAPALVDAERLVSAGDISGAGAVIDSICDSDPRNAKCVRDRFALFLYQKGIEAAATRKKEERLSKHDEALAKWKIMFKDVDAI
jgi:hypothetical protein